jgi:hypothetical protein
MSGGCQAPVGGVSLEGVDLTKESVIQGVVTRGDDGPGAGVYVRLLDAAGEFTAEVPTNDDGEFRFFAAPGPWTVRALAPRAAPVDRAVVAQQGALATVEVSISS